MIISYLDYLQWLTKVICTFSPLITVMTDAERVAERTRSFLDEYPDAQTELESLVELDRETNNWTFDDVELDSGRFGELVSQNIAESTDEGFRLVNTEAVATALQTTPTETSEQETASIMSVVPQYKIPACDGLLVGTFLGVLSLVVITRILYYNSVFQDGWVISPGNDPYFFRYWQREFVALSEGPTDIGMLGTIGEQTGVRPFSHVVNWWLAEMISTPTAAAWTPVAAAVLTVVVVYLITIKLTDDHRMGLSAGILLALTPIHAVYTGLGFIDHNGYQYLWLALLAFVLVWLAIDITDRVNTQSERSAALSHAKDVRAWIMGGVLAFAVAATIHSWGGSPLSFIPVGVYIVARVAVDTRRGVPALPANAPMIGGLMIGVGVAAVAHVRWGWHEPIAVTIPMVVVGSTLGVAILATVWNHLDLPVAGVLITEIMLAIIVVTSYIWRRPADIERLRSRSADLFTRDFATETVPLFTTDQAVIFGPLGQLGTGFYLALVPLVVATWVASHKYKPAWLATVVFAWSWLAIATIQVRFAAQFAIFCAVFGGVGVVYLFSAIDVARPADLFNSGPNGAPLQCPQTLNKAGYLGLMLAGILLVNLIFVPTLPGDLYYSDEQAEATQAIAAHSDKFERAYPENRVISRWGNQRMHNHFVNGESRSYDRSIYDRSFISAEDPDRWVNNQPDGIGYIVLRSYDSTSGTPHDVLFNQYGAGEDPTGHFQLIHSTNEIKSFAIVNGAVINTSTNASDSPVTARAEIHAAGESFPYQRRATTDENGTATVRVAYPGTYKVSNQTITVTDTEIEHGAVINAD